MKLQEMSELGNQVMYGVIFHQLATGKEELQVVTETREKAESYMKQKIKQDIMEDGGTFSIIEVMKYE